MTKFFYSYRIVQRLFKTTVIFLLLFYLIVPVFVKTNPWIQSKIIFLNNCKYTNTLFEVFYTVFFYTPGIYADGYIVFAFPFVCSFVRSLVRFFVRNSGTFVEFMSKFWLKFL